MYKEYKPGIVRSPYKAYPQAWKQDIDALIIQIHGTVSVEEL